MSRAQMRRDARAARVKVHWISLIAVLLALTAALAIQGYTHQLTSTDEDSRPAGDRASAVAEDPTGEPILDTRDGVDTAAPKDGSLALTFDDGPDPVWTPRILDVLEAHGVHATFFLVGTAAAEHPDIVRRIIAEGHEIGTHTLTHADLAGAPDWRTDIEFDGAQSAVAGAGGITTSLFRPPYSSTPGALDKGTWDVVEDAGARGYLSVLSTLDSRDWERPGVDEIVANSTPPDEQGQILLMHDGGGNRSETVAALERLLPELQQRGITVTTVGASADLAGTVRATTPVEQFRGTVFVSTLWVSAAVVALIGIGLVIAGIVMVVRAILVVVLAAHHRRLAKQRAKRRPWIYDGLVSVIVPAHNEAAGIEAAVRSIAASRHPVEIIVVDDGSADDTAAIVEALRLPQVTLIRQANGGKPSALNTGIAAAHGELIVMVDGDTVFEEDTVARLIQPFEDSAVGAVSGNTKVANRGGVLGAWQHIEYVVGFNLDRRLFDVAECMPTVPGAIGAFRRSALKRVGGVSDETLAEDTDLTMALCRDGWRVVYQEDARAWTEAPATLGALWKQRYRWCYGTLQAMWKHRGAMRQKGQAGKLGRRGLTYLLVLQVLLPLFAPLVDVFAIYGLFFLDPMRVLAVWLGFLAIQLGMAVYAFRMDGESLKPLWTLPLQQVVYRQLMYLVVIQSVFTAIAGNRLRWHRMKRYGSLRVPPATANAG
ncbi:bifunctional polysaccharide deacetylase/glycosyltransferase family 2 protein [Microbacterium bovistercoris]|nr:bifunctional polysaccharide deacetylase/glycosyltransferase family 2 protein [Microbacterium bovistercoris]